MAEFTIFMHTEGSSVKSLVIRLVISLMQGMLSAMANGLPVTSCVNNRPGLRGGLRLHNADGEALSMESFTCIEKS